MKPSPLYFSLFGMGKYSEGYQKCGHETSHKISPAYKICLADGSKELVEIAKHCLI